MPDKPFDESHIERKYFIDGKRYNCPYCNIRSIQYGIYDHGDFDWTRTKKCFYFTVTCSHCEKESLHLSFYKLALTNSRFCSPPKQDLPNVAGYQPILKNGAEIQELDDAFFYHQPTSFFTIDSRIPEVIRELISEADGCLKMNYLVGGSGCLRKAIYELLRLQEIPKEENSRPLSYEDRIKKFKIKFPLISASFFDTLATIQDMTSDTVHENSWESFDSSQLHLFIDVTKEILCEIYVIPDERESKNLHIQKLRDAYEKTKIAKNNPET
jgi:hypothetical protein